jgi:hypothetical protein
MPIGNVNKQLAKLVQEGLTIEQACRALNLDVDAGQMAMMSTGASKNKVVSLGELVESFKPQAVEILMEIAKMGERDADRVKACQILLEGKGIMPEVNAAGASNLIEMFEQMKRATNMPSAKIPIIEAEEVSFGK